MTRSSRSPAQLDGVGERHRLLVWMGDDVVPWRLPAAGEVVVGRASNAGVRIEFLNVSRRHARITTSDTDVRIADLGSQNGTRVNGQRLSGERSLHHGDIIGFGDVRAVFAAGDSEDTDLERTAVELGVAPKESVLEIGGRRILVADVAMHHVYTQIARLADGDDPVLIGGEAGTGKGVAVSALHGWSGRKHRPLVAVKCSALAGTDGGEAGLVRLLEDAAGGTVWLDDIDELSLRTQAELAAVIETRPIDVRIVGTTAADFNRGLKERWFDAELVGRLSAAAVRLLPLRMRLRELPLLARRFLLEACHELERPALSIGDAAMARLLAHDWPGNVRQLKNLMRFFAATISDEIGDVQPREVADSLRSP
jgi:transcriptional regulator of acetoin/glycerol metabolism